jgi:hypothetical protein
VAKSTSIRAVEQVDFRLANGQEATADFSGGDISGLGGLPLLVAIDDDHEFLSGAARCIKDGRLKKQVTHTIEKLLKQAVLLYCAGYPDGIDWNYFRQDPILKFCLGWDADGEQHAASQAGQSRFMTERSERDLRRLFSYCVTFYIRKHSKAPKSITLDFDGAAAEVHGRQQFIAYNGHYEVNMYYPLFVMDGHGWLIAPILRPGNVADANITVDILKVLVKRFRRAWPKVKILFRGDAAFHDPDIMDWCEANGVDYVTGLKGDNHLNVGSKQFDKQAEKEFKRRFGAPRFDGTTGSYHYQQQLREISALPRDKRYDAYAELDQRSVRKLGDFRHLAGRGYGGKHKQWKKERRVISRARVTDRGLKRRYLVTSLEGYTADKIYDEIYSARGKAELVIRAQRALGADRLNSSEARTNQMRMIVCGLAYNLFQLLVEKLPSALKSLSTETLIHNVARIAVQVKVSTRRTWLRWTSSYPLQNQILKLCDRLNLLPKPA